MLIQKIDIKNIPQNRTGKIYHRELDEGDCHIFNTKNEVLLIKDGQYAIKWVGYGKRREYSQDARHQIKTALSVPDIPEQKDINPQVVPPPVPTSTPTPTKTSIIVVKAESLSERIRYLLRIEPLSKMYSNLNVVEIKYLLSEFDELTIEEWEFMNKTVIMPESERQEYCKLHSEFFEGIKAKDRTKRIIHA